MLRTIGVGKYEFTDPWHPKEEDKMLCPSICTLKYLGEDEEDGMKKAKLAKTEEFLREKWADTPVQSD
ncbi:kelch-like protein 29 [Grus japonensis]|uniref:Kelch-like protein 29 n=1 Tax=Grus japonensis TaxID=30415 RepID=A0ABC9WIY6_GRUJA